MEHDITSKVLVLVPVLGGIRQFHCDYLSSFAKIGSSLWEDVSVPCSKNPKRPLPCYKTKWEGPKIRGTLFGGPYIIRTVVFWVYIGVPLFWETTKLFSCRSSRKAAIKYPLANLKKQLNRNRDRMRRVRPIENSGVSLRPLMMTTATPTQYSFHFSIQLFCVLLPLTAVDLAMMGRANAMLTATMLSNQNCVVMLPQTWARRLMVVPQWGNH